MAKLFFVKELYPYQERPFTNRAGQPDVIETQELLLSDGLNHYAAEAVGKTAKAISQMGLKPGGYVAAELSFDVREFMDGKGTNRRAQSVRIERLTPLWGHTAEAPTF